MQKKGVSIDIKEKYIRWFSELGKKDVPLAGGKGANLGEMYNSGFPVPPGFAVTANAYKYFLEETNLDKEIYDILSKTNIEDTKQLDEVSKIIKKKIQEAQMPEDLEKEIIENYELLGFDKQSFQNVTPTAMAILEKAKDTVFVAVRSSATAEDTQAASFAGQNETFLNVKGSNKIIQAVKNCFASLFTSRSIYYRIKKGFRHEAVLIAVIVQIMVNSDKSGIIFSRDPMKTSDNKNIVIESVYGLGEGIVSGRISPDHYVVSRDLEIKSKIITDKKIAIVRNSAGENTIVKLTEAKSKSQVLTDYEINRYADFAIKLEEHYKRPQDIEFAIDSGNLYLVQTRPITTLKKEEKIEEVEGKVIIEGQPASPGIGSGEVKIVYELKDLEKIKKGDVLVAKMTNPDMVVAMQKSAAIVTDEGGATSHAAIISREMGIPAVIGTQTATSILKDGMTITVDGYKGKVYEGKLESLKAEKAKVEPIVPTHTKIKVIVDLPHFAARAALTKAVSIGLTRLEGIIAESGKHPFYFVHQKKINDYEKLIYEGLKAIAEHFEEIWIRTSDIRSDEYRNLEGAPSEVELNPMLGMHGIRAGLKYPDILKAELRAAAKLAEKKKIGLMIPQIILVEEIAQVKKMLEEIGIPKNLQVGIMVETPAAVQIIEELCMQGIEFISFGTNDLTQYTLAIDRGNEHAQYLYNETNPAVLKQLAHVIQVCKRYKVETSICGQAGSDKKMVEFLVKQGIDSISINADKAKEISEFVKEIEDRGLRGTESGLKQASIENLMHKALEKEKKHAEKETKEVKDDADIELGIDVFTPQTKDPKQGKTQNIKTSNINEKQQEILHKLESAIRKAKQDFGKDKAEQENPEGLAVFDKLSPNTQESKSEGNPELLQKQQQMQQAAQVEEKIKNNQEKLINESIDIGLAHLEEIHKAVVEKSPMEKMLEETLAGMQQKSKKKQENENVLDIF